MRDQILNIRVRDRIHRGLDSIFGRFLFVGRLHAVGIDHLEALVALRASAAAKLRTFALTLTCAVAR